MDRRDFERRLNRSLPLDPVLDVTVRPRWIALRGSNWDMSFDAAWRATDGSSSTLFGWSSPDAAQRGRELIGLRVVDVTYRQDGLARHPETLVFDSGWRLEVFHDFAVPQGNSLNMTRGLFQRRNR